MSRFVRFWRRPAVYRTAIGLYVMLVLVLAGAAFAIYSIDVDGAMYVRGDTTLEVDRPHGLQGRFSHAPSRETIYPETMEWTLESGDGEHHRLEFADEPMADYWPNTGFRIGDDVDEGDYELRVHASHELVDEMIATRQVQVSKRSAPEQSLHEFPFGEWTPREDYAGYRWSHPVRSDDDGDQSIALEVSPPDGELVRGVNQQIVVRTFEPDTGRPIPAEITLEKVEGMLEKDLDSTFETDEFGFGSVEVRSTIDLLLDATVRPVDANDGGSKVDEPTDEHGGREGDNDDGQGAPAAHFRLFLPGVPASYSVEPLSPVVTPGESIEAFVYSTIVDREFVADLKDTEGQRLLDGMIVAMGEGEAGLKFTAPDTSEASRLLQLQVYRSIYQTSYSWDDAYLLLLEDDSEKTLRSAATELYSWIADEADSAHHRAIVDEGMLDEVGKDRLLKLIEWGLRDIPRTFEPPQVLMNTRAEDQEALDAWRVEAQSDLRVMMIITFIVGLVVVVYFIILGIRRTRRENALMQDLSIELDESHREVDALEKGADLERLVVVLQGIIVFATLVVFALGILLILGYL